MPRIALDMIDIDEAAAVRRTPASQEEDAALRSSIAEIGVLQPVLLMPVANRYSVVDGARRISAARMLNHTDIAAEVTCEAVEGWITAASAAANMVRANMAPLDRWRVMAQLQRQGYTLLGACAVLGLSERQGRKLDKLSKLHPDVLALLGRGDWPNDKTLALLATAPAGEQKRIIKEVRANSGKGDAIDWRRVGDMLEKQRIPSSRAIFDIEAENVAFEEDMFAQPGDDALFTTDIEGFLAAQNRALTAIMAKPKKGVTYHIVAEMQDAKPARGADRVYGLDWRKAKAGMTVYLSLHKAGWRIGEVDAAIYQMPAPAPKPAKKADATPASLSPEGATDEDEAEEGDGDVPSPPAEQPEATPASGITKAGLTMIAEIKTAALRDHLGTLTISEISPAQVIACLVLMLTAPNVRATGISYHEEDEIRHRLVHPAGAIMPITDDDAVQIGLKALAWCLTCSKPDDEKKGYRTDSGPVAEWIGHATGAARALPRFDNAKFLATVKAGVLSVAAVTANMPAKGSAAQLRQRLEGNAAGWRPAESQFGAPGPTPKREAVEPDNGDGDAENADG